MWGHTVGREQAICDNLKIVETISEIWDCPSGNESRSSGRRSPGRGSPSRRDSRGEQLSRNHSKPGGCKRKDCVFFHPSGRSKYPPQSSRNDKSDFSYRLAGHRRKNEDKCYGKHEPRKCGTKAQKETSELLNQDFVNTLVRAVSQGLAGV